MYWSMHYLISAETPFYSYLKFYLVTIIQYFLLFQCHCRFLGRSSYLNDSVHLSGSLLQIFVYPKVLIETLREALLETDHTNIQQQ